MKIDGRCHCGRIGWEADIDPDKVAICHCSDCQVLSGTAFRTVVPVAKENFRILSGTPKVYVKTAESGNRRAQAFCGECGSPIYAAAPEDPPLFSLRLGTARQRRELEPKLQAWRRSACGWVDDLGALPRHETGKPA